MLPFDSLIAFFGIAALLALTPGPDNLFVLMQSAIWGRKAGLFVVLGLCTGLLGHTATVALGLGAVFMLATLLVFGAIAFFSGAFGELLQRSVTAKRWLNRIAALVFVGLAVRLATATR